MNISEDPENCKGAEEESSVSFKLKKWRRRLEVLAKYKSSGFRLASWEEAGEVCGKKLNIIFIVWNLHGSCPSEESLASFVFASSADLVIIGTSECLKSINESFFDSDKSRWETMFSKMLAENENFKLISSRTLQAIHLMIFARTEIFPWISVGQCESIATGAANILGNKGGIIINLIVKPDGFSQSINIAICTCHLEAHEHNKDKRIKQLNRILSRALSFSPLIVLVGGDFNFRLQGLSRAQVDSLLRIGNHTRLMRGDEWSRSKLEKNEPSTSVVDCQLLLNELEDIHFPPTYKLQVSNPGQGFLSYDTSALKRIPSWTDRILYCERSQKDKDLVKCIQYDSLRDSRILGISDHCPVVGQLQISLEEEEEEVLESHEPRASLTNSSFVVSSICSIQ